MFDGSILTLLLVDSPHQIGLVGAVALLLVPAVNALVFGHVAETAPDAIHGRAVSATVQAAALLQPMGPALVGLVLEEVGTRATRLVYGAAAVVLALAASVTGVGGAVDPASIDR